MHQATRAGNVEIAKAILPIDICSHRRCARAKDLPAGHALQGIPRAPHLPVGRGVPPSRGRRWNAAPTMRLAEDGSPYRRQDGGSPYGAQLGHGDLASRS